jgi:hypothetical protein
LFVLAGLVLTVVVILQDNPGLDLRVEGSLTMALAGFAVAGWGVHQLRRSEPLNAPPRRSRLWLGLLVLVLVLLLIGGGWFGFMYYLHEML